MDAVLIDLSNYATTLVQSTQSRAGTPDGNVFFNRTTGTVEFITKQELAQVDLGSGLEDNPLDEQLGIKMEAFYAFENQERASDEVLRGLDRWTSAKFKFAGAYVFINSRKPATSADRAIIRASGWSELAEDKGIDRIYFGNIGLANIEPTSQPYSQLAVGGAPTNFAKAGNINEAVQVYGSTGNTPADATAGDFDSRTYEAVSVRTFGKNYDRKETTTDLAIAELGGYATGFALNESDHLTTGNYALADVYGGAQIAPFTGLSLEELDTPETISGFSQADGDFTWVLNNTGGANLDECVAYLDALAQTDDDINIHATNVTNGKRVNPWYSYNAQTQIVTKSGADTKGLYIHNIPASDGQRVVFTDDSGATKSFPFMVGVEADIGAIGKADPLAWYHGFFAADYNTTSAVTIQDNTATAVKGLASTADASNLIKFDFDYDADTVGGTAGTDKNCVFLCEGNGGATQAKTLFVPTRTSKVAFSCAPAAETNV